MRYLFKRLDQQTTTTAHPQWAMGTHRSALSHQLGRVVADLDTPFSFKFPLLEQGLGLTDVSRVGLHSGDGALGYSAFHQFY